MNVSDMQRLQSLAQKQMELANSKKNLERTENWKNHNKGQRGLPLVHIELDTFEHEIIPPMLQCTDTVARQLETDILRNIVNFELFDDDWVVSPYFGVYWKTDFKLFGYSISKTNATDASGGNLGHHFNHVLADLEEDFEKLHASTWSVDKKATTEYIKIAEDAFGDILPVKIISSSLEAVPTQKIVHLMGMENMFTNMLDYPELFSEMMTRVADDYISYYAFLQNEKLLCSTTGFELLQQGSKCFTDLLPNKENITPKEMWGFMDSQETVSISPDLYKELIFPCYEKIASQFGLLSYGCCEPVSDVWEYVKTFENLRKVSISPWCNQEMMGEELKNTNIIFHRKPSPNILGIEKNLDEDALRSHIKETLLSAQGCAIEFTQRDVYTVHNDIPKVKKYVQIIREECEKYYK